MKKGICLFLLSTFILSAFAWTTTQNQALQLVNTIPLAKVKGGFDLMAVDVAGKRLFVSAEDNHSVEVIDLKAMKPLQSLKGFQEPKWIVYRPESNRLYVATGLDGKVTVLDSRTYKTLKSFTFKEKCNNLRFDAVHNLLYVGVGNSFGSIGVIDLRHDKIVGEIRLSNYPKQFELVGHKVYANVPASHTIEIADLHSLKVIDTWKVNEAQGNVPMGIDRKHQRLFVGCESGKLLVLNMQTGERVASLDISKDCDGIYYNAKLAQIYISCGEGFIDVVQQKSPDIYYSLPKLSTAKGAGTSLFIPELDFLVLAVPQNGSAKAEMRIYRTNRLK